MQDAITAVLVIFLFFIIVTPIMLIALLKWCGFLFDLSERFDAWRSDRRHAAFMRRHR